MRLEQAARGIRAVATDGHGARVFDLVLYATGRGAEHRRVWGWRRWACSLAARGQIMVDGYSQTAVPSIFAVGDVTDRINLTPVAIREGHAFADTVFGGKPDAASTTSLSPRPSSPSPRWAPSA